AAFLAGQIGFTQIASSVEAVMGAFAPAAPACLDDVLAIDAEARMRSSEILDKSFARTSPV
ncbi:MAG: 1-deoxy-D-xylulose-5-phosphate reductoisomerase, partial [Novosphingobium sp.]|nr:1-deoxy-D-xylulose-5-phosphate reductoisomerase [Novosphingobium sp.]